jgi:hypothetical protein
VRVELDIPPAFPYIPNVKQTNRSSGRQPRVRVWKPKFPIAVGTPVVDQRRSANGGGAPRVPKILKNDCQQVLDSTVLMHYLAWAEMVFSALAQVAENGIEKRCRGCF